MLLVPASFKNEWTLASMVDISSRQMSLKSQLYEIGACGRRVHRRCAHGGWEEGRRGVSHQRVNGQEHQHYSSTQRQLVLWTIKTLQRARRGICSPKSTSREERPDAHITHSHSPCPLVICHVTWHHHINLIPCATGPRLNMPNILHSKQVPPTGSLQKRLSPP